MSKVFATGLVGLSAIAALIYLAIAPDPTDIGTILDIASTVEDVDINSDMGAAEPAEPVNVASTFADVDERNSPEIDGENSSPTAQIHSVASTIGLDQVAEIQRRSRDVNDQFASLGPQPLSELIDQYISRVDRDESWELSAEQQIRDWYLKNTVEPESLISIECVMDVCYIDTEMTALDHMIFYKEAGRQWADEPKLGFLRANFSARSGDTFHRIYFFRDSFKISEL